jgi:hypothetical protein
LNKYVNGTLIPSDRIRRPQRHEAMVMPVSAIVAAKANHKKSASRISSKTCPKLALLRIKANAATDTPTWMKNFRPMPLLWAVIVPSSAMGDRLTGLADAGPSKFGGEGGVIFISFAGVSLMTCPFLKRLQSAIKARSSKKNTVARRRSFQRFESFKALKASKKNA